MAVTISSGKQSYSIIWNIGKVKSSASNAFYLENSEWCFLFESDLNPHQNEEDWKMYLRKIHPRDGNHVFLISVYAEDKYQRLQCLNFTRLNIYKSGIEQIMWRRKSNVLLKYPDLKIDDEMNFVITILSDHRYITDIKNHTASKLIQTPSYMEVQPCLENLSNDFEKLLANSSEPDLEVRCENNSFHVHKAVLIARSDVFAAMLQSDMLEKSESFIEIVDMEYSILEMFFRYLYTGVFPNVDVDKCIRLFEVADKYCVDALKMRCVLFLKENLTVENACNILVLADNHCDKVLKQYATSYIIQKDMLTYMENGEAEFCAQYPKLAFDVLCQAYRILKTTLKN